MISVLGARSLTVDKDRVNLGTLIMALFYDLATEKEVKIPSQPEKRERQLLDLISNCLLYTSPSPRD